MKLFAEKFEPVLSEAIGELYELYVYVDGQFFRGPEARMSVWNRGLWYGDAVFEGLRAYDGQILKLEEHLKRLHASAKAIAISIPLTSSELAEVIHETLRLNDLREAHIRVIVIRGVG